MKRNKDQWVGEFDYSDPAVFKEMFKDRFNNAREYHMHFGNFDADIDTRRLSRRQETAMRNVQYAREMIGEDYPAFEGTSHFEEDWAYLNADVSEGYDAIDRRFDLVFAAAIWILDTLNEDHYMYRVEKELLPELTEEEAEEIPSWLIGYDAVFSDALLMKTVYVLIHRNDDCKVYTPKGEKKRNILDEATVRNKNMQDVPSRQRFERLIEALNPEKVQSAVDEFREKYWFLARAFFAGLRKNHAKRDQVMRSHDRLVKKLKQYTKEDRTASIAFNKDGTIAEQLYGQLSQNFKNVVELDHAIGRCADQIDEGVQEKMDYAAMFREYLEMTPGNKKDLMPEELNERMKDFTIENPYRLAFALLYLADRSDDLIWMYFFGTSLAYMTAESLPWKNEYDEFFVDDLLERHAHEGAENILPDFYEKHYSTADEDDYFNESVSLAQLMFEMTGVILPRNLNRFDCLESYWNEMHVPADEQKMMRLAMCLMDASVGYSIGSYSTVQNEDEKEETGSNEAELKEQIASLKKRISSLAAENKALKDASYNAQKQTSQLNEKLEEIHRNTKADREELAKLREVIFLSQNPEKEIPDPGISLPYESKERIVICGGHDSFIKQLNQMITGNVRILSNVRINEDLIRNAASVWIQTNAISHSDYYKITDLCRKYEIPMYYFLYSSARKCAEQIVETANKKR